MLIDWFTVAAQIINFLVLVWLLKRFAYKPILNAIDAREKRIVAQQADAAAHNDAAKQLASDLQKKTAAFDNDLATMKAQGAMDITKDREQQLTLARQDADQLRANERGQLLAERRNLGDRVTHMATEAVFDSVRRALTDLGSVCIDERILDVFAERLGNLDASAKDTFKAALKHVPAAAVRSRFVITEAARQGLQKNIDAAFGSHIPLEFAEASAVVGGIEVSAGGQTISWTMAEYLRSLSHQLDDLLDVPAALAVAPT